jgi:hypothetical protein
MGGPLEYFLTHTCNSTHPLVHGDICMYCRSVMCNDEACNVVKCSLNANIHVYVHGDLHEICLLNVKDVQYLLMNVIGHTKIR